MNQNTYLDWDEALAIVQYNGRWRFFHDIEVMFLLDYSAYDGDYVRAPGEFRYGIVVVNRENAVEWMNSLAGELSLEQLSHTYWRGTDNRVQPTFIIDFDRKLWVGRAWKMDQSPLADYQPRDWTALEDDVKKYLPVELSAHFE